VADPEGGHRGHVPPPFCPSIKKVLTAKKDCIQGTNLLKQNNCYTFHFILIGYNSDLITNKITYMDVYILILFMCYNKINPCRPTTRSIALRILLFTIVGRKLESPLKPNVL
jgi:hypothetical protein